VAGSVAFICRPPRPPPIRPPARCCDSYTASCGARRYPMLGPFLLLLASVAPSSYGQGQRSPPPPVGVRLPLELEGKLEVKRSSTSEPPFVPGRAYQCVFGRAGQFSLHMPPQDYHELGVHTTGHGEAKDANTLLCTVPKVVTAGNTTVCVMPPNVTRTHFPAFRPAENDAAERRHLTNLAARKHVVCGVTPCEPCLNALT
jgi:hypothetical protein